MKDPTILVVDDDINFISAFKRNFKNSPYRIITCYDAMQAIAVLKVEHIDVLITDQAMSYLDGLQLLLYIDKNYPDIPRIMVTGKLDLSVAQQAINYGRIHRFLTKPYDIEDLRDAIQECLLVRREQEVSDSLHELVEMQAAYIESIDEKKKH